LSVSFFVSFSEVAQSSSDSQQFSNTSMQLQYVHRQFILFRSSLILYTSMLQSNIKVQ
jgi:hypothetical protein